MPGKIFFDSLVYFYITIPNSDYIFLQFNVQIYFLFHSSYLQLESGIYLSFQLTGYFRKFYTLKEALLWLQKAKKKSGE